MFSLPKSYKIIKYKKGDTALSRRLEQMTSKTVSSSDYLLTHWSNLGKEMPYPSDSRSYEV